MSIDPKIAEKAAQKQIEQQAFERLNKADAVGARGRALLIVCSGRFSQLSAVIHGIGLRMQIRPWSSKAPFAPAACFTALR